ncbi:hypothetical protein CC78DRAFT_618085, partial [Lojkania enalia]
MCILLLRLCFRGYSPCGNARHPNPRFSSHPPAPPRRASALTLSSTISSIELSRSRQSESLLMSRLPLELRQMIYEVVLGGRTVHISLFEDYPIYHLVGRKCSMQVCYHVVGRKMEETNLCFSIALLATCRQIYTEAINILYTANAFSFLGKQDCGMALAFLDHYLSPQRLDQLRVVNMHWDRITYPLVRNHTRNPVMRRNWDSSWKTLARMKGLQKLFVRVDMEIKPDSFYQQWDEWDRKLFECVKLVVRPTVFVITLPDPRCF